MQLVTLGGAALRLSPPGTERLETTTRFDAGVTGPECNAAVAARRLGAEAVWLSRLAATPAGRRVERELRASGVDVVADAVDGRQGIAFVERGSEPRGDERVDDLDGSVVESLAMESLPAERVETADTAYVSSATPRRSPTTAGATAKFLKTATDAATTTAFGLLDTRGWSKLDAAKDTVEGLFPAVDVLVATDDAVETILGRDGEPAALLHTLASSYDLDVVAMRRRGDAAVWQDSTVHEFTRPAVDAVDTAGAVDAFVGAFLATLDDGAQEALRTAIAADALTQTTPGAQLNASRREIEAVANDVERS